MGRLAPGSALAISAVTTDNDRSGGAHTVNTYNTSGVPVRPRTHAQVAALFGDLQLVEPGCLERHERTLQWLAAGRRIGTCWCRNMDSATFGDHVALDPSRVAAQVVSGIGFIGGGLIFVRRDAVRGLTTAAVLGRRRCGPGRPVPACGCSPSSSRSATMRWSSGSLPWPRSCHARGSRRHDCASCIWTATAPSGRAHGLRRTRFHSCRDDDRPAGHPSRPAHSRALAHR
jgi:hypothetical protein